MDCVAWSYVALTTGDGQVTIGDEIAASYGLEEGLHTEDHCPLDAWKAIDAVAEDDIGPLYPVGFFPGDEVADDVFRAKGVTSLVGE